MVFGAPAPFSFGFSCRRRRKLIGRHPNDMSSAATLVRSNFYLFNAEARAVKSVGEFMIWCRRPYRQHAFWPCARCARLSILACRKVCHWRCGLSRRDRYPRQGGSHRTGRPEAIKWPTLASRTLTLGSSRQPPVSSAIGPRAHSMMAGTSSAAWICASAPRPAKAARSVKPIPYPPISMRGFRRSRR